MMKKLLSIMAICTIALQIQAQLVISEIMYNSPDAGQDTLEYIELYNNSASVLDIQGYTFTAGLVHTFDDPTPIAANGHLVICNDPEALNNFFGVQGIQWTSGGLNNSGEEITIENNGTVVATVTYGDRGDWPTEADGDGYSLEICDVNGDNADPANWGKSLNDAGFQINSIDVFASPKQENTPDCDESFDEEVIVKNFEFTPKDITIDLGETIQFRNTTGTHNVNGSQSTFPDNPESFNSGSPASGDWTYTHTFNVEGVYNYQCDPHAATGMKGTVTVINDVTVEEIGDINNTDNATGIALRLGESVVTEGIVMSPNFNSSGYSFTIQDEDDGEGINIYSRDDFGYTVQLGDEIQVAGTVDQFNGLTQISLTSITVLSENNDLLDDKIVTSFGEENESQLVTLEDVSLIEPSDWNSSGSYNVSVSNGTDTFTVRIDGDTELDGKQAPEGVFDISGVLGQFDPTEPYLEGYQLTPRFVSDIDPYNVASPDYPNYEISVVTTVNADGVLDSNGVDCTLEGYFVGENFSANGYQIVIINEDNSAGVMIFSGGPINGLDPDEGDLINVKGKMSQFNGLAQINAVDMTIISEDNDLPSPDIVSTLDETTENRYIQVEGRLVSSDVWAGDGSSANYDIDINGDVFSIRIDGEVSISDYKYDPSTQGLNVTVTGVGGQFDSQSPFTQGYQILPFDDEDVTGMLNVIEGDLLQDDISVYPNPVDNFTLIESKYNIQEVIVYNNLGQKLSVEMFNSKNIKLNTEKLIAGSYILIIKTDSGIVSTMIAK